MQNVGGWPSDLSVGEPVARVLVDGKPVQVTSLSVESSLDSVAPEWVATGGGAVVAATGDVSVVPGREIVGTGANPWTAGKDLAGAEEVVVEAGYKDPSGSQFLARLLTAQVDSLTGGASNAEVGLSLIDHTGRLNKDITIEPLLRHYPALTDWGPMRGAGLSPIYVTDRILRHCGFYATPPMLVGAVFSAPLMGSAVPEKGTLVSGWAASDSTNTPAYRPTPWGMGLGNGQVTWYPDLAGRSHGRLTSAITVSFTRHMGTDPANDSRIDLLWDADTGIRVTLFRSGTVRASFLSNGSLETIANLVSGTAPNAETFQVRVTPSGDCIITTDTGVSATGSGVPPALLASSDLMEVFAMIRQQSRITIGGLQVAFSTEDVTDFVRTAHIDPPAYYFSLEAFPFQHDKNCLDLLKEQAEAELAAMWIDEYGHFHWKNRNQLRGSVPVGTLTSLDDLLDLPWDIPVRSVYSRVEVESDTATVTRRSTPSLTVQDGGGQTLTDGEEQAQFIEPPSDEDWHGVKGPEWLASAETSQWLIRRGRGSYRGGVLVNDATETETIAQQANLVQSWARINPQRWLLTSKAQGLSTDEYIDQRFMEWPANGSFKGRATPLIRARGVTEWGQETFIGSHSGPALSPVFTHTVGPWIQSAAEVQDLADWLSVALTSPDVVLKDVPIVPDPRIQKGDVFWLEDTTAYGVKLKVVVVGTRLYFSSSDDSFQMSQSITCRVISSTVAEVTLADHDEAWACSTLARHDAFWAGFTLAQHDNDPLANNNICPPVAPTLGEHDAVWLDSTLLLHDQFWAGKTLAQHDADPLDH